MKRGPHTPFERLNSNKRKMIRNAEYLNDWRGKLESWWRKYGGGSNHGSIQGRCISGSTPLRNFLNICYVFILHYLLSTQNLWINSSLKKMIIKPSPNNYTVYDHDSNQGHSEESNGRQYTNERFGSFKSFGVYHDNNYKEEHHFNIENEHLPEKEQEYKEDNDNDTNSNKHPASSNASLKVDKRLNDQEKEEAESMGSRLTNDNFKIGSLDSPPNNLWYYKDSQGKVQGPFLTTKMSAWYNFGYFPDNLMLKRSCDDHFYFLGDLVRIKENFSFSDTQFSSMESNLSMTQMYTAPITPRPQPQPNIHPMNLPNNSSMIMLSHMEHQQQQQQPQQLLNDRKYNVHAVPTQSVAQQLDPLHSFVQSIGRLKTSTSPSVNTPHHHQSSNVIQPNNTQPENNAISDLLRQLRALRNKPFKVAETNVRNLDFTGPGSTSKMNDPTGIGGWPTAPSFETSQQPLSVLWASGEYTNIIGAGHKSIANNKEETIKEEGRQSRDARKQEIKQNEQIRKEKTEKSQMKKEFKKTQELEKAKLEEDKKNEKGLRIKKYEKKLEKEAEKKNLEEEQSTNRRQEKQLKEEKEKKKEDEKSLQEEENKRMTEIKNEEELKKREELKQKEKVKNNDQKKKDEEQKKTHDNSKSSAVPIVTEPQKKKKKELQVMAHNGVKSAPWATAAKNKKVQVKSIAEIQAEERKQKQMIKQKECERVEREIVAIEQAKQEKSISTLKMQSRSTVVAQNVRRSYILANNSAWGSTNQMK